MRSAHHTELQRLVAEIESVAADAASRLPPDVLGKVLSFLTKVSHVLEQAYRDVIPVLIDIKHLDAASINKSAIIDIEKKIDTILAVSHYRDAEEICSRLKSLKEIYLADLASYIGSDHGRDWNGLFGLIEEREGRIIMVIRQQLSGIIEKLHSASRDDIVYLKEIAPEQICEIQQSLKELNKFNAEILGLSGEAGLLEILRDRDGTPADRGDISISMHRNNISDQRSYSTTGDQSPLNFGRMATRDIINNRWPTSAPIDLGVLATQLSELRKEMKSEARGTAEEDIALGEIAKAEAAAKAGDQQKALQVLKSAGKWALSVAEKIGVGVAIAAMKPLVGG